MPDFHDKILFLEAYGRDVGHGIDSKCIVIGKFMSLYL